MKCNLTCPNHGTLAKLEVDRSPIDGRLIGVRRCSLAEKDDWVDCDRLCIKLLNERIENQQRARGDRGDRENHASDSGGRAAFATEMTATEMTRTEMTRAEMTATEMTWTEMTRTEMKGDKAVPHRPVVEQYMTRSPHKIESGASLEAAHKLMRKFGIRHLPVTSKGDLVGVVSMGDLHLLETLKDVDTSAVQVEEAMSEKPYVVDPDTSVREVAAKMAAHKLGSVVVVDQGEVVGIFTTIDALVALLHIFK